MPNLVAPIDGRMQVPMATGLIANVQLGRPPMAGLEPTLDPNTYIVSGSWPRPKASGPSGGGGFSGLAAASKAQPEAPKSSAGALALWPNLK
jgi:hypothetical protein